MAALERREVPVDVVGIGGLLERPEIVDLLAWLELLADRSRNVALVRLLRAGPRGSATATWRRWPATPASSSPTRSSTATARPIVLADAVAPTGRSIADCRTRRRARLDEFCDDVDRLDRAPPQRLPARRAVRRDRRRTDLWVEAATTKAGRTCCASATSRSATRRSTERQRPGASSSTTSRWSTESEEELGEATPSATIDAVKVMTIHQAKGLEFDQVWVPGLGQQKFPSDSRGGDNPETLRCGAAVVGARRHREPAALGGRVERHGHGRAGAGPATAPRSGGCSTSPARGPVIASCCRPRSGTQGPVGAAGTVGALRVRGRAGRPRAASATATSPPSATRRWWRWRPTAARRRPPNRRHHRAGAPRKPPGRRRRSR